jgi:hypothetical protein
MIWQSNAGSKVRALGVSVLVASAVLVPSAARAEVRHDGEWDDDAEKVTLELERVTRSEAVKRLAAAAGWSLVFDAPPGEMIDVHINGQPASKVLDILLSDGRYVAKRNNTLVSIRRVDTGDDDETMQGAPFLPIPQVPPTPPLPRLAPPPAADDDDDAEERGTDRLVTGENLRIEKGEVVDDVIVMGGSVDVFGTATGDVVAMGGSVRVHDGAHVHGDATALGGSLSIEDGARVDGDVDVLGGMLRRGDDAQIHGKGKHKHRHPHHARDRAEAPEPQEHTSVVRRLASEAGDAVTRTALLFVFGAVLLALSASRMEALKVQIATRPMRSFATGVVASIAALAILIALCVTLIGIPFAILGVLVAPVAACAGLCAVLETAGGGLLGHKTKNPYVHLAFGCVLFMFVGAVPFVGNFVMAAALLTGIGSVVATRAAGLLQTRNRSSGTPYRDAPAP